MDRKEIDSAIKAAKENEGIYRGLACDAATKGDPRLVVELMAIADGYRDVRQRLRSASQLSALKEL